ncbi:MAG: hypothetical protein KDD56_04555 [Bdellovibrionales bacterium]|nr:hypothetical protein [Bdellovibrionales bacterium]
MLEEVPKRCQVEPNHYKGSIISPAEGSIISPAEGSIVSQAEGSIPYESNPPHVNSFNSSAIRGRASLKSLLIVLVISGIYGTFKLSQKNSVRELGQEPARLNSPNQDLKDLLVQVKSEATNKSPQLVGLGREETLKSEDVKPSDDVVTNPEFAFKTKPRKKIDLKVPDLATTLTSNTLELPKNNQDGRPTNGTVVEYRDLISKKSEEIISALQKMDELKTTLESEVSFLANDDNGIQIKTAWEKTLENYSRLTAESGISTDWAKAQANAAEKFVEDNFFEALPKDEELRSKTADQTIEHLSGYHFNLEQAHLNAMRVLACFNGINSYLHPSGYSNDARDSDTGEMILISMSISPISSDSVLADIVRRSEVLVQNNKLTKK